MQKDSHEELKYSFYTKSPVLIQMEDLGKGIQKTH